MVFVPAQFYELGQRLGSSAAADEATIRTAIGRVYYAAFLSAREVLWEKRGFSAGLAESHGKVISELNRGKTTALAGRLKRLRELREHSDYHLDCADGPFNPRCTICERVRRGADSPTVDVNHWKEALNAGETFIRQIVKVS